MARRAHPCPLAGNGCQKLHQHPRYVAAKRNTPINFICYTPEPQSMQWYKTVEDSDQIYVMDQSTSRFSVERKENFINFTIFGIRYEDNGVYVCDRKNLTSENKRPHMCGTELRVMGEWEPPVTSTAGVCPPRTFPPSPLHVKPTSHSWHQPFLCWWDPFRHSRRCSTTWQMFLCVWDDPPGLPWHVHPI